MNLLYPIQLKVRKAKDEYPVLFSTFKHRFPQSREEDIAMMVSITVGVCSECWKEVKPCNCSVDKQEV